MRAAGRVRQGKSAWEGSSLVWITRRVSPHPPANSPSPVPSPPAVPCLRGPAPASMMSAPTPLCWPRGDPGCRRWRRSSLLIYVDFGFRSSDELPVPPSLLWTLLHPFRSLYFFPLLWSLSRYSGVSIAALWTDRQGRNSNLEHLAACRDSTSGFGV